MRFQYILQRVAMRLSAFCRAHAALISTLAVTCFALSDRAHADTLLSFGAGSAVTTIDRSATFDNLDFAHNGTALSDYQANGLFVKTNGNSYYGDNADGQIGIDGVISSNSPYLNPFHLTSSSGPGDSYVNVGGGFYFPYDGAFGNTDWVTIQTNDAKPVYALEFLYGNGWTNGDIYGPMPWGSNNAVLEWQTYSGSSLVSSGSLTTNVGTVLGFSDPNGFDQLRVRATGNSNPANLQELALDNLNVQLTVPEPSTFALLGVGAIGLIGSGWRKSSKARITSTRLRAIGLAIAVIIGIPLHAGVAHGDVIMFFNSSQVAIPWASGATSETIRCDGYQFTYTLDQYWSPTGSGTSTGRLTPITWPTGIDAQTITAGPNGVLSTQIPAQVTITRVDGSVFDIQSFRGELLGNTAGAGAAFEIMPLLNGNDGFPTPQTFDATGYAGNSFTYQTPMLTGFDTYNISLWMDFGLTGLTVNGTPVPEPATLTLLGIGAIGVIYYAWRRRA